MSNHQELRGRLPFFGKKIALATCLAALALSIFTFARSFRPHPKSSNVNSDAHRAGSINAYGRPAERPVTAPVAFEPNFGQFNQQVKFVSRANGYNLFLTSNQAVVVMGRSSGSHLIRERSSPQASRLAPAGIVRIHFLGASAGTRVEGERKLPGRTNYFVGDPKNWRSNVPQYSEVTYRGLYPGTDLVFYGNPQKLEMDFRLQAGAKPENIVLGVQSGQAPKVSSSGDLVMEDSGQQLILRKPRAYQKIHGTERDVAVNYRVTSAGQVRFAVETNDPTLPLVVDPVVAFSTFLGGSDTDLIGAVTVDSNNNPYVFGATQSPDFPTTTVLQSGVFFITKFNAQGSAIVYSTLFGGGAGGDIFRTEFPAGIAVDANGNAYVAGTTQSTSYPTTANAFQKVLKGGADAFVTKFSLDGSAMIYSTFVGGSGNDTVGGMALDPNGEVIIVGQTVSNDFPTMAAFQGALNGTSDAFVAKLNAAGSALVYSTYLGGSSTDQAKGVASDSSGNAFVAGITNSSDFPLKNAFSTAASAAFVTELSAAGALSYSTFFKANEADAIAVDSTGIYVAGKNIDPSFLVNPITCGSVSSPCFEFLSKFNLAGSSLIYSTTFGESSNHGNVSTVAGIAVDSAGDVFIAGSDTNDLGFNFPLQNPVDKGGLDYLIAFASAGNSILYSTGIPAFARCNGCIDPRAVPISVAADSAGNAYVAGISGPGVPLVSPEQPAFGGGSQASNAVVSDGFLMKIANANAPAAGVPGTVSFGVTPIGMSSTRGVQLADLGSSNLTVTNVQASGDFSETDNCVGTVSAASTCTINITFAPTAAGTRNGTITITDNAAGSPQSFALIGVGGVPQVSLVPSSLTFVTQSPGTTSPTQPVQVNNIGQANLVISRIDVSASFQETNNCPSSVAPGSSCTVSVAFAPSASASGPVSGTLTITDNASGSPHTVTLKGTAGTPSLGLAPSGASSQTVSAGSTTSYTLSIGGNGVGGTANLSCSGALTAATCNVPSTASVSASTASTFTAQVTTTSRAVSALPMIENDSPLWAFAVLFFATAILAMWRFTKRALRLAWLIPLAVCLCSCGSSSSSNSHGTPAGTYTLTVTATSGSTSQSVNLTLIVQ